MARRPAPQPTPINVSVEVAAAPERVWEQVEDPRSMPRFSPELRAVLLLSRKRRGLGTSFLGVNRRGLVAWPTVSRIVRYEPGHAVAWKVRESGATWSYELEPTASGTRLTGARELASFGLGTTLLGPVIGGATSHDAELAEGIRTTLQRIKAAAEGA